MGWKHIARVLHPVSRQVIGKTSKDGTAALQEYGRVQGVRSELDKAEKDYANIPTMLRGEYLKAAQRGGTYGNTPEFMNGLNSEVQAGARGARTAEAARINALRRSIGNTDEFKVGDKSPAQTQGNVTQEALKDSPLPQQEASPTQGEAAPQSDQEDAVASTQRAKALKKAAKG